MNILSLDGGGVLASHTAVVLDRLETILPGTLAKVDLFAGTSAGGLICLVLANGGTTKDVLSVFANSSALFTRDLARRIEATAGLRSKYDDMGRLSVLTQRLGDVTLGQIAKPIAIQAFQLDSKPSWRGRLLHNVPSSAASRWPHCRELAAVDAGMMTSAAPTYFPTFLGSCDGGVASNDPAMSAVSLALDPTLAWPKPATLADVRVFSIGRLYPGDQVDRSNWDAGYLEWLPILLDLLLTSGQSVTSYQCEQLLGSRYFRHQPLVPEMLNVAIDDAAAVPGLEKWADGLDLSKETAWLRENW